MTLDPFKNPVSIGSSWAGLHLANSLVNLGIDVGVVTKLDSEDYRIFDPRITIYDESYISPRSANKDTLLYALNIYNNYKYDILNMHPSTHASLKWASSIVPDTCNLVYTIHNSFMSGRSKVIYGDYASNLNDKSNVRIVPVSDYTERAWNIFTGSSEEDSYNTHHRNVKVIYNSCNEVDLGIKSHFDREYDLGMCSRIDSGKMTYETLVSMKNSGLKSLFIGSKFTLSPTSSDEYYNKCVDILENSDNIDWFYNLSNSEVIEKLSNCKFLLDLSLSEACSMVVLESLYVGTPVIYSSYCEGIRDLLSKTPSIYSYELEFPYRSRWSKRFSIIKEITNKLVKLDIDSGSIHDYYMRNFSIDKMVNSYIDLYSTFGG